MQEYFIKGKSLRKVDQAGVFFPPIRAGSLQLPHTLPLWRARVHPESSRNYVGRAPCFQTRGPSRKNFIGGLHCTLPLLFHLATIQLIYKGV